MKNWLIAAAAALTGGLLLLWLFPRYDGSSLNWKQQFGRQEAIRMTREVAALVGVAAPEKAHAAVRVRSDRDLRSALKDFPGSEVLSTFPYLLTDVRLTWSGQPQEFQATWASDRRLLTMVWEHAPPERTGAASSQEPDWLPLFAGGTASRYKPVASAVASPAGVRKAWEWRDSRYPDVSANVEVLLKQGRVVSAGVGVNYQSATLEKSRQASLARFGFAIGAMFVFCFVVIVLMLVVFFSQLARSREYLKFGLRAILAVALILVLMTVSGNAWDEVIFAQQQAQQQQQGQQQVRGPMMWLSFYLGWALLAAMFGIILGSGLAVTPPQYVARWSSLALLLRGKLFVRKLGSDWAKAWLMGLPLAAIPLLVAASPLSSSHVSLYTNPAKLLAVPTFLGASALAWGGVGFFGFLWPLSVARIRNPWLRFLAVVPGTWITWVTFREILPSSEVWASLADAALAIALYWVVFRMSGVLGVIAVEVSSIYAAWTFAWAHQPAAALQSQAWAAAGGWVLIAGGAIAIAAWGRQAGELEAEREFSEARARLSKSEREKLNAEFGVARRAQEGMLPSAAPQLAGYSIAAACHPAREVGGDLFEFLTFPDGRTGLIVADVSGKGVPAALFMTLTKGMLASASHHARDLGSLALMLNQHLHTVCRKRTFVTMAMGVLDPSSRTLEYLRAGHNPILWRKASNGETNYVAPPGMALGLTSNVLFERNLRTETLHLGSGDIVVFYSDGLTEAMNPKRELFGEERLRDIVAGWNGGDADALRRSILEAVHRFTRGAEPSDDLTLLVMRVVETN